MIHAVPERMWYVNNFLVPSLLEQGIDKENITIYEDVNHDGNVKSTIKSFMSLPEDGYTWHLQDDVIIAKYFTCFTEKFDYHDCEVVCGFESIYDIKSVGHDFHGLVEPECMFYSFQCIRISNSYAHEFVKWLQQDDNSYSLYIRDNKFDDYLFKKFMIEKHSDEKVYNLTLSLVDHIDYLIGGSLLSKRKELFRARNFTDTDLIEELENKLKR